MPIDPESFKVRDAFSYDGVAGPFAYWTERVTSSLANRLVELACLQPTDRVLDVGTGSGVIALRAAKHLGPQGRMVGVDLSQGMLESARASTKLLATPIEFLQMDAERLDFGPASFDIVLSLFAVLHFPNPERAIQEMFRVVRPGGRVVIGIGRGPSVAQFPVGNAMVRAREYVSRARGKLLVAPQALDRFVTERVPQASEHEKFGPQNSLSLEHLLRQAGFQQIEREWKGYTHLIETSQEFWSLQITFSSVVRKRLESVPPEVVTEWKREFCAKCERVLARGGTLIYRNAALIVRAIHPKVEHQ